jgi:ABC-type molybdate transport system substrate-binding protein
MAFFRKRRLMALVKQAIKAAGLESEIANPVFGPAGGLRERIEKGEAADLYLSANMEHPRTLAKERPQTLVMPFGPACVVLSEKGQRIIAGNGLMPVLLDPK